MVNSAAQQTSKSTRAPPGFTPIVHPERIPARRYYDEAFYKLECERLWPRVWQMACRLEEIPEPGDFVEYKVLDKSVIIVRSKDGGVNAFHNACRHRGVKLAQGYGNCKVTGFRCPFHGWRYDMNGRNTFVFQSRLFSDENLDPADLSLRRCRVETWGAAAFINFDDNAPPLLECIEPFATVHSERHVEKMKTEWWRSTILPVNWKLALEAFMEGWHAMRTHPQLTPPTIQDDQATYGKPPPGASASSTYRMSAYKTPREMVDGWIRFMRLLSEGMGGMIHAKDVAVAESLRNIDLPHDLSAATAEWHRRLNDEIEARGRAAGLDMPNLNGLPRKAPWSTINYCFPNYFLLPYYGNMASYRVRPLGPESCLFEIWSLTLFPEGDVRPKTVQPEPIPLDDPQLPAIPLQDYSNLPLQQQGLHAYGFEYMRLARDVEGLISNYQRLIDGFLTGVEEEKLIAAMRRVHSGIDAPISDIGF
jgi:carnitine monooxygenase subunit